MNEIDFFSKKVRLPYDLDGILGNNFNYENGSFYNQASSDYKKRINFCFNKIEDDLKMDLVDFVDDWLPILKAELIEKEKNLNTTNTDSAKDYLIAFISLKYDFFSQWVKEKRKQTEKLYQDILSENTYEIEKNTIDLSNTKENEKIGFTENSNNSIILQWYGNQTELIELIKALIENGNLKGKQEDIFDTIQKTYNFKLNNIDQAITKFNSRNQENETKFLDTLKTTLSKYIETKLEKNR